MFCLFRVFAFLYFVVLCFVIDPFNRLYRCLELGLFPCTFHSMMADKYQLDKVLDDKNDKHQLDEVHWM